MQNLQGTQADRDLYLDQDIVRPGGSKRYVDLYMSATAVDRDGDGKPKGIPAEDLHNFATEVFILKDHHDEFEAKRQAGEVITHIDFGTGPNIYNIIAGLGEMDKSVAVELAPSNLQTLNEYKNPAEELPDFWNSWLDLGVILHDIGSPQALLDLDKEVKITGLNLAEEPNLSADNEGRINLYDSLRKWPLLSEETKALIRHEIYESAGVTSNPENPYKAVQEEGLQQTLTRKLEVRQGDLFNPLGDHRVPSIADLAGTAHFNTATFVTESNTRKLSQVLHAEANKVQFSKPDGVWVSSHMAGTEGYEGFFTEEQLAENPDLELEECPMSRELLTKVVGEIVHQDPRYLGLTAGAVAEHRKMVREGKQYSEAVIVAGKVDYLNERGTPKFENGDDFMNQIRSFLLRPQPRHAMNYTTSEGGQAVRDFRTKAQQFAEQLGPLGNDSVDWNKLNQRFWDKYSETNYDNPIPGDIEGMFSFIENMRQKKGGTYLDVGTGSAPEFAVAAVAAGMRKITVSDYADGAIEWLEGELLDEQPLSDRTQMWVDIAKLLSTFKDKNELLAYCHETGFDKDLRQWQKLAPEVKEAWFNERRLLVEQGQAASINDSFLDNNEDIKAKIKAMYADGNFAIRKFSILNPPEDLIGQTDLVTANSVASCISQKASEYCQTILNVCRLARPGSGIISTSHTPYDNWKQYTVEAGELPSIPRHNHYYSVAHSLVLKGDRGMDGASYDRAAIAKEIASVKQANADGAITFEGDDGVVSLRKPGDNRFEHLIHISGTPKDTPFQSAAEMLGVFQIHMLGKAEAFLLEHPNKQTIRVDATLFRSAAALEKKLGMEPQNMRLPDSLEERRVMLADRIEHIIEYLEQNPQSLSARDKQDEAINQFVDNIYERLVGRSTDARMATNVPAFAARR